MDEWRQTTLGALAEAAGGGIQTGPFGSQLHASDYVDVGVPVVMPVNIGDNRIDENTTIAQASQEDAHRLDRHRLKAGDIVYSRRGDVERRALIRPEQEEWLCGTGCLRVRLDDPQIVNARFVSYLLGAPWVREWIVQHAVGATMLNLNTKILSSVPLFVPTVGEQRAIAEVLGALDDKIAANLNECSLLEGLGRALFTKAAAGPATETVQLDRIANHRPGKYLPKDRYVAGGAYAVYGSNSVMGRFDEPLVRGPFAVLARIGSSCGNLRWSQSDAWVNNNASAIIPHNGFPSAVLRWVLESIPMAPFRAGSGQPFIRVKELSVAEVRIPSWEASERLAKILDPLSEKEAALVNESETLAATRDALLPALMSGKLRVKDAERQVEEAV